MFTLGWKIFKKIHSRFIFDNQNDVLEYLRNFYSGINKIKHIIDMINIRTDTMEDNDLKEYEDKTIPEAYSLICDKKYNNIELRVFEKSLYEFVINKFEFYKILKTLYLSVFYTVTLSVVGIIITIVLA